MSEQPEDSPYGVLIVFDRPPESARVTEVSGDRLFGARLDEIFCFDRPSWDLGEPVAICLPGGAQYEVATSGGKTWRTPA